MATTEDILWEPRDKIAQLRAELVLMKNGTLKMEANGEDITKRRIATHELLICDLENVITKHVTDHHP